MGSRGKDNIEVGSWLITEYVVVGIVNPEGSRRDHLIIMHKEVKRRMVFGEMEVW